jgi:hypothetical protein
MGTAGQHNSTKKDGALKHYLTPSAGLHASNKIIEE